MNQSILTMLAVSLTISVSAQSNKMLKALRNADTQQDVIALQEKYPKWNVALVELSDQDATAKAALYSASTGTMLAFGNLGTVYKVLESQKLLAMIGGEPFESTTDVIKLGRSTTTKNTSGQSGQTTLGFDQEYGIRISGEGKKCEITAVNFHLNYNTMDSVLFRVNIYDVKNGLPGESVLTAPLYVKAIKNEQWISAKLGSQNLEIDKDVIVSYQAIEAWPGKRGENRLFFTHGEGYYQGGIYSRDNGSQTWSTDKGIPVALYLSATTK